MKTVIILILSLSVIVAISTIRTINVIEIKKNCTGYLERAANSNTVETAKKELERALKYIEKNNLTEGYTSVLYQTPDEDIGFWYNNIKSSYEELSNLPANSSGLEKSNMLLKLRETLTDNGENGTHVVSPNGLSIYPYNTVIAIIFWGAFIVFSIVFIKCLIENS